MSNAPRALSLRTIVFLCLTIIAVTTMVASVRAANTAGEAYQKALKELSKKSPDWKVVEKFARDAQELPEGKETKIPDYPAFLAFPQLARGNALFQLAKNGAVRLSGASDETSASQLYKQAAEALEASYKQYRSPYAYVLLCQVLVETKEHERLDRTLAAGLPGDLKKDPDEASQNAMGKTWVSRWDNKQPAEVLTALLSQLGPRIAFKVEPPYQDRIRITGKVGVATAKVRKWELFDGTDLIESQETQEFKHFWPTLDADKPISDGLKKLVLKLTYDQGAAKNLVESVEQQIDLANPAEAFVDLEADDARHGVIVRVFSPRTLLDPRIELTPGGDRRLPVNLDRVTGNEPPTLQLELPPDAVQRAKVPAGWRGWRYLYRGFYSAGPNFTGSLGVAGGLQKGLATLVPGLSLTATGGSIANLTGLPSVRVAITSPKYGEAKKYDTVIVKVTSTADISNLEGFQVVARTPEGKTIPLKADPGPAQRMGSSFAHLFRVRVEPGKFPFGPVLIEALIKDQHLGEDVLYVRQPPTLEQALYERTGVKPGDQVRLVFVFDQELVEEPSCTVGGIKRRCEQVGPRTYQRIFRPYQSGEFTVSIQDARDSAGNEATVPSALIDPIVVVKPVAKARLRIDAPEVFRAGSNPVRVYVDASGGQVPPQVAVQVNAKPGTVKSEPVPKGDPRLVWVGTYFVPENQTGTVELSASTPGMAVEGADLTIPVDGVRPQFSVDPPSPVLKAGRFEIRFRPLKTLVGPPTIQVLQADGRVRPGSVRRDPEAKSEGLQALIDGSTDPGLPWNGWMVAEVEVLSIPGPASVVVDAVDTFGNSGRVQIPLDIKIKDSRQLVVQTVSPWTDTGVHTIRVFSPTPLGLEPKPELHVVIGQQKLPITLDLGDSKDPREWKATVRGEDLPKVEGTADLVFQNEVVARVRVEAIPPKPDLQLSWSGPQDRPLRISVRNTRRLDSLIAIVSDPDIKGPQRLTPLVQKDEASEWYLELPIKDLTKGVKVTVTARDVYGREGVTTKELPGKPREPAVTTGVWRLVVAPTLVGAGGRVSIRAFGPAGDKAEPQMQARVSLLDAQGNPHSYLLVLDRQARDASSYEKTWVIQEQIPSGTATVSIRPDEMKPPVTALLTVKTDPPELEIETAPIVAGTREIQVSVRSKNREPLHGYKLLVTGPGGGAPDLTVNGPAANKPAAVGEEFRLSIPTGAKGSYLLVATARDEANNVGQTAATVVVGGGAIPSAQEPKVLFLDKEGNPLQLSADGVQELPAFKFRVPDPDKYKATVSIRSPSGYTRPLITGQVSGKTPLENKDIGEEDTMPLPPDGGPRQGVPSIPLARGEGALNLAEIGVEPQVGQYVIRAELEDQSGKKVEGSETIFTFKYRGPDVKPKERLAIIVAYQNYDEKRGTKPLELSYEDARVLRETLKRHGYLDSQIHVITDGTKEAPGLPGAIPVGPKKQHLELQLLKELEDARRDKIKYLLFAYTGHGMQVNGEDVLIPPDFNADNGQSASFFRVRDLLDILTARSGTQTNVDDSIPHVLALIDACQSTSTKFRLYATTAPQVGRGHTAAVYYACAPGQVSQGVKQKRTPPLDFRGSVFTQKFVRLLDEGQFDNWRDFEAELEIRVGEASRALKTQGDDEVQSPNFRPSHSPAYYRFHEFFDGVRYRSDNRTAQNTRSESGIRPASPRLTRPSRPLGAARRGLAVQAGTAQP